MGYAAYALGYLGAKGISGAIKSHRRHCAQTYGAMPTAGGESCGTDIGVTFNPIRAEGGDWSKNSMTAGFGVIGRHRWGFAGLFSYTRDLSMPLGYNNLRQNQNLITATVGPRYAYRQRSYTIFGDVLLGYAHDSDYHPNKFAIQAGGGVNYNLSRRIAVRLPQVYWLRTWDPGDVHQYIQAGAGIVFRLQ